MRQLLAFALCAIGVRLSLEMYRGQILPIDNNTKCEKVIMAPKGRLLNGGTASYILVPGSHIQVVYDGHDYWTVTAQ